MGSEMCIRDSFSLGIHPSGMKNAVISPHAMIAPMFGMIMLDRKVPNFCTCTRAPLRGAAVRRVDVGADLDDLAGDLVADGARGSQGLVAVVEDLHVRAAGRAVADPQLDLAGPARGLGDVFEADIFGGVEPQGLHEVRR